MSRNYYQMCQRGVGRAVHIRTTDGRTHRGIIHRVTPSKVYLQPLGGGHGYGGYGYGWGWGGGWGWGFGAGIAIGAIASLAFISLLWI